LAAFQATGAAFLLPCNLAMLVEAYAQVGQPEEGLNVLTEALAAVNATGERFYEAELYRLTGELTLQKLNDPGSTFKGGKEAEECFQKALNVARGQSAKSLELRAATSLARLWQSQGKETEARDLLAPVYDWFTEGFDTADLKDAKALLDMLGKSG
jgi:predicted ATPase